MKPSLDFSPNLNSNELKFNLSEMNLPRFETSTPVMNGTMNIPEDLMKQGAPLEMSSLMNDISTSDESESDKPAKKPDRFQKMEEGFLEQFATIGVSLVKIGAEADGTVILSRAEPLAHKLTNVARQNPAAYRAMKKYLDGSVYAMLAEEIGLIGMSICLNHGINPVEWFTGLFRKKKEAGDAGNDQLSAVA